MLGGSCSGPLDDLDRRPVAYLLSALGDQHIAGFDATANLSQPRCSNAEFDLAFDGLAIFDNEYELASLSGS